MQLIDFGAIQSEEARRADLERAFSAAERRYRDDITLRDTGGHWMVAVVQSEPVARLSEPARFDVVWHDGTSTRELAAPVAPDVALAVFTVFLDREWAALDKHPWEMRDVYVGVVVDPDFGDRLLNLAPRMPIWVAATPPNRAAAERVWATLPGSGVTTFTVDPAGTPETCCIAELETIDLHHGEYSQNPPYSVLEIFGTEVTPGLWRELDALGFGDIAQVSNRIHARRTALPGTDSDSVPSTEDILRSLAAAAVGLTEVPHDAITRRFLVRLAAWIRECWACRLDTRVLGRAPHASGSSEFYGQVRRWKGLTSVPLTDSDPCRGASFSRARFVLLPTLFLCMTIGNIALFFQLVEKPYGIQAASAIAETVFVVLFTFAAYRGLPPYMFTCPVVQSQIPRLLWRHLAFFVALFLLQTLLLAIRPNLPDWWNEGVQATPFVIGFLFLSLGLAGVQVFTNRSLLDRAHTELVSQPGRGASPPVTRK